MRAPARPSITSALQTGLRCRCPHCREGTLFRGWPNRMKQRCPVCGLAYFREPGYYVGGMIFSYALTAFVLLVVFFALMPFPDAKFLSDNGRLAIWMVFALGVNLGLMRLAYSLWLSIDFWMEPWSPQDPE